MLLLAALAFLHVPAPAAEAQQPAESLRLQRKVSRRLRVVHPPPDEATLERDAAQAVAEMEARERTEELIRETVTSLARWPHLHYDVFSGIQSRHLTDALRRR